MASENYKKLSDVLIILADYDETSIDCLCGKVIPLVATRIFTYDIRDCTGLGLSRYSSFAVRALPDRFSLGNHMDQYPQGCARCEV